MIDHTTISAAPVSMTSPWIVGAVVPCGSRPLAIPPSGATRPGGDPARRPYGVFATA